MPSLFSGGGAEGWHAPAGRRTCEPRPLVQDGQIRPAVPAGAIKTWDPADRSFRRTTRAASAESEVRPGPRLPTLRPHHLKTGEAGPEALPTLSLPGRKHYPHSPCRLFAVLSARAPVRHQAQIVLICASTGGYPASPVGHNEGGSGGASCCAVSDRIALPAANARLAAMARLRTAATQLPARCAGK